MTYDGTSGSYTFSWWGKAGRNYFIQHSEDLMTWTYVPMMEQGADHVVQWGFSSSASCFFLRLESQTDGNILPDSWLYHYFGLSGLTLAADSESPGDSGTGKGWTLEDDFFHGTDPTKNDTDGDGTADTADQYPLDPNRNQDVPVTQLAALDISGSNTEGNDVTMVALDDSNHAAFAYTSGTNIIVKAWANGSITTTGTVPNYYDREPESGETPSHWTEWLPNYDPFIDATGNAYGLMENHTFTSSDYNPANDDGEPEGGLIYSSSNGTITPISMPDPYGNHDAEELHVMSGWGSTDSRSITPNGSYTAIGNAYLTGTDHYPTRCRLLRNLRFGHNHGVRYEVSGGLRDNPDSPE